MSDKLRNFVSWRLDKLSDNEKVKINAWLDEQGNIQKSITNVVMHAIDRFGNTDIMDHDIQKLLFHETATGEFKEPVKVEKPVKPEAKKVEEPKEDSDDFFDNINEENL